MNMAVIEIEKPVLGRLEIHQVNKVALPLHPAAKGEHRAVRGDAVRLAMEKKHRWQFPADHFRGTPVVPTILLPPKCLGVHRR